MTKNWSIILILLLAATLRLYGLERGDTVNDEVFYGFRAIGLLDFDNAETQKTPLEWWDPKAANGESEIPWWTKLSFHDHPPLVFWVQHIFIKVFGSERWVMRLPSAILGVASVWLVYLIGNLLFKGRAEPWGRVIGGNLTNLFAGLMRKAGMVLAVGEGALQHHPERARRASEESKKVRQVPGLIAALFFAVTLNNVYISRTGMQEAYVIFFMLLASYLFLKALENDKYLIWTGVVLGLAFLTKYTTFILVPIFLAYILLFKRALLWNKKLWLGALLSVAIFSPVLVYNVQLYRAAGHFDFQISHIIGQAPEGWRETPGKEIGTFGERIKNFVPRLTASHSWLFLGLFAVSLFFLRNAFSFLVFVFLILFLLSIGPSYRFLTMLTPWMALSVGFLFAQGWGNNPSPQPPPLILRGGGKKREFHSLLGVGLLFPILLFEIFYTYNNQIAYYPKGPEPWFSSKVRYENYNWGYNALDDYFKKELFGKMPALTFFTKYKFIEDIQDTALEKARGRSLAPSATLVTYYGNFDDGGRLWVFDRRHVYEGWPIIPLDTYFQYLRENGTDYYQKVGFRNYYFIQSTNIVLSPEFTDLVKNIEPVLIYNPRGDIVFKVYKLTI